MLFSGKKRFNRPLILLPTYHEHGNFSCPLDNRINQLNKELILLFELMEEKLEKFVENLHLVRPKSWHWIKVNETKINKYTLIKYLRNLDYIKFKY